MAIQMPIAVVGMSCRFPGGAESLDSFWRLLQAGESSWSKIPKERFNANAFFNSDPDVRGTFNCEGAHFLESDIRKFDAHFFGINPKEAATMDPQQRLQLECAYEALESGGLRVADIAGSATAVFVSIFNKDYDRMLFRDPDNIPTYHMVGNGEAILSNRISHIFDLRGPSVTLDTGCSGGLVALHLACQSIRTGESKQAIVGGTNLILAPEIMASLSQIRFFSPQGRCYSHDERAAGYGRGEGAAALLIKPLRDALRDGDPIRAVIRSTAINQDGWTQGITLPSKDAQIALIRSAYANAGLDVSRTAYCEAHGTGTAVGDPIEAEAIATVFEDDCSPREPLYLGSVKTNIGHLESASGLAGLIKTVLMLERGKIVPNYDFQKINPRISPAGRRLKIPTSLLEWPIDGIRQASVNSFGYGGTNCHAVLDNSSLFSSDQAPPHLPQKFSDLHNVTTTNNGHVNGAISHSDSNLDTKDSLGEPRHLFVISGKSSQACVAQKIALKEYLGAKTIDTPANFLSNLSYTLCSRRSSFSWRWATSATTLSELKESLIRDLPAPQQVSLQPNIGFVFTGQGSQWYAMGREMMHSNDVFMASMRRGDEYIRQLGATWSLTDELSKDASDSRVNAAELGQPLVTVLQLALVDLLSSWGIRPCSVVGHSSGEIAAAYAAGMVSYESAVAIAYWRGEHTSRTRLNKLKPSGSMMAVPLSEAKVSEYMTHDPSWKDRIVIACSNSPSSVTLSGDSAAIEEIHRYLEDREVSARFLKVDTAYHSHHMQDVADNYQRSISNITPNTSPGSVSFFSSVTATQAFPDDLDSHYWIRNLVSKVRFYEALQQMCHKDSTVLSGGKTPGVLIEIGPHAALATPIKQTIQAKDFANTGIIYLPTLKRNENAILSIYRLACQLWSLGATLELNSLRAPALPLSTKSLTDLPRYQWDRSTDHWSEPRMSKEYRNRPHPRHELLGSRSIDFDPILPKWRNYLRLSEAPWLRDHVIESQVIYPAAAFLSMVLEAVRQMVIDRLGSEMKIQSVGFRDVSIERALILHDDSDGVEVLTTLQPIEGRIKDSSTLQYSFLIRSIDQQEESTEHCRGSMTVATSLHPSTGLNQTGKMMLPNGLQNGSVSSLEEMEKETIYDEFSQRGIQYRGNFATVSHISRSSHSAKAVVDPPELLRSPSYNVSASTPVHTTVLDGCFQVLVALILRSKIVRRPPLLNFIRSLDFLNFDLSSASNQLQLRAKISTAGSLANIGNLEVWPSEKPSEPNPLIFATGIRISSPPGQEKPTSASRPRIYRNELIPDIGFLEPWRIQDLCCAEVLEPKKNVNAELEAFETLSLFFVQRAFHELSSNTSSAKEVEPLCHLWNWMRTFVEQNSAPDHPSYASWNIAEVKRLVHEVQAYGDEGKMLVRIGYNLSAILSGTAQPLPLMLEDDLLTSFYHNDSLSRCYHQMGKYLQLLGLKNPKMAVLEIGAGTGGTTVSVLEALSRPRAEDGFMFESYDFTDISSGFFDKAQSLLKRWKGSVNFKRLDIEKRPSTQGFRPGHYDLVLASNVLHATTNIENTIRNVRELLKPGGKFVLLEITRLQAHLNVSFGGLPGWWAGVPEGRISSPLMTQALWGQTLQNNDFSKFDVCLSDYEGEARRTEVLVSTAVERTRFGANFGLTVCIDRSNDKSMSIARALKGSFEAFELVDIDNLHTAGQDLSKNILLFLGNMTGDSMITWTEPKINHFLQTLSKAKLTLWITHREAKSMISVADDWITGLTRSWNLKNPTSAIRTLSLSPSSTIHAQNSAISALLHTFFNSPTPPTDMEYIEDQGQVSISRLLTDELATDSMIAKYETKSPNATTFQQGTQALQIENQSIGPECKLAFPNGANACGSPEEEMVEISPQFIRFAAKANEHLYGRCDQFPDTVLECSGIIRRVGSRSSSNFKVGDPVCAIGTGPACNHFCVPANTVHLIPSHVSFADAVSIPIAFVTAQYCLNHIAKAQEGDSILIYQAASTLGQAVIAFAQLLHLDVYAEVQQVSEQTMLNRRFGVQVEHIFTRLEVGVSNEARSTESHGKFDVIVGCSDSEFLQEAFRCVAFSGTIVSLGSSRNSATMYQSEHSKVHCTVSLVDADLLYHQRKSLFQRLLTEVMQVVRKGSVVFPLLPNIVSLSTQSQTPKSLGDPTDDCCFLETNCNTDFKELEELAPKIYPRRDAAYIVVGDGSGVENMVCNWLKNRELIDISLFLDDVAGDSEAPHHRKKLRGTNMISYISTCCLSDLAECLDAIKQGGRVLGGVFHVDFAGMNRKSNVKAQKDAFFSSQRRESSRNLKHLLDLLQDTELDFFAAISSVCGLTGVADMGKALDSSHRNSLITDTSGRPYHMLALELGTIANSGRNSVGDNTDVESQAFEQSLCIVLDTAFDIQSQKGTVTRMVVDVNSEDVADGKWPISPDPRFLHTGAPKSQSQSKQKDEPQSLEQGLQACHDLESSTAILCTALARRLGKLLACPPEEFKPSSSIAQFGIDSLVAAELRAWIFQSLGSPIKIEEILGQDKLIEIAKKIAQRSPRVQGNLTAIAKVCAQSTVQSQVPNGFRHDPLESKAEENGDEKRHTLYYQGSLPTMPVPALQTTLGKYLQSIRPLLTDTEYTASKKLVADFGKEGGIGEVLQERLEARSKDPTIKNWLYEYWVTHYYLNPRKPIAPATNFFMAHEDTVVQHSMARRAAIITKAVIDFKNDWDEGTLEPAMLHEAPICMESYHWLFNACRIPKLGGDKSRKSQTSNHIAVVWRNSFFRLEAEQHGKNLGIYELESLFSHILKENAPGPEAGFGLLTTEDRDLWARTRTQIKIFHPENASSISSIESSAFVICLDEQHPQTSPARAHQFWHGNGSNRYSDKPLQFIVTPGNSGFNGEHSRLDGSPTIRLNRHVNACLRDFTDASPSSLPISTTKNTLSLPIQLPIHLNQAMLTTISAAETRFNQAVAGCELEIRYYTGFGETFLREMGCHPSTTLQMVFQLATYRFYGRSIPSFEPVGNFRFKQGRYDAVRSLSSEVAEFCVAMTTDGDASTSSSSSHRPVAGSKAEEQIKKLRTAMNAHIKRVRELSYGGSIDNHMFGLWMSLREGEATPPIFTDPVYRYSTDWFFSTSYMPADEMEYGFGPDMNDGWSVQYPIWADRIMFCITTRTFRAKEMGDQILQAADDIKALLLIQQQTINNTDAHLNGQNGLN